MLKVFTILLAGTFLYACNNEAKTGKESEYNNGENTNMKEPVKGSFGYDVSFLQERDSSLIVLKSEDELSQVIVSPKYQAKVFTASAAGLSGKSFGWVNYKAFDGPADEHMNAYGGADRLWLGPEGGTFSLYFPPGTKMELANWTTPAPIDTEPWVLEHSDASSVTMSKHMSLTNYAGTRLEIGIDRTVTLVSGKEIHADLGITVPQEIKSVAFRTVNSLTNKGQNAWDEKTGAPCMWSLDMFTPSEACTIVIPYNNAATGKVATTDYFGAIAADRISYSNGILFFKADGKSRGKLGIPPARVKNIAGSYDAGDQVLTIVKYDIVPSGKYLNQEWRTDKDPFSGDAMNAYNDGPLEDG